MFAGETQVHHLSSPAHFALIRARAGARGGGFMAASAEDIVMRARALIPALRARAEQCEELRRLPDETVHELREAGLFRTMGPKAFGGHELGLGALARAAIEVGQGC